MTDSELNKSMLSFCRARVVLLEAVSSRVNGSPDVNRFPSRVKNMIRAGFIL